MVEKTIKGGMDKFYYLMKLSAYFWVITLCGGIVLGIGPAILAIANKYQEVEWDFQEIRFKEAWTDFKQFAKVGNVYFLGYLSILALLVFSLITTVQWSGLPFLILAFIILGLLFMLVYTFFIFPVIYNYYDISLKNGLKLAFVLFFYQWKSVGAFLIFMIFMGIINYKVPAFLLFITSGAVAVFMSHFGNKLLSEIELAAN